MNDRKRRTTGITGWLVAIVALCALPGAAAATTFSFGTIEATDVITSIIVTPSADDTTFTSSTGSFVIDAYVSTINFANRAPLGIPAGAVTFSSQLTLSNIQLIGAQQYNILAVGGELVNGLTDDFSITDVSGLMVGGNFDGPMDFLAQSVTSTVSANLSAEIGSDLSGDMDFLSAFGPAGSINLKVVLGSGSICTTIATCPSFPSNTPPAVLHDFSGPLNGTIIPIPEPGTAMLLGLGLLGLTRRARVRRMVS